jgi:TonB family protein
MNRAVFVRACLLAASVVSLSAHAEWRCDCATIVDACSATVTVESNAVSIASDHRQCSRVDYLIDGLPFVALVVDGQERQSWLTRSENPRVLMQSCQVCLDNAAANAPVLAPRAPALAPAPAPAQEIAQEIAGEAPEVSRLIAVDPKYPSSAASSGVEGFVEVSFTVTALGRVENAFVTAAEPPGVFEQTALAAISRWRYSAEEGREPAPLKHRFEFKAKDAASGPPAPSGATVETAIDALIAHSSSYSEDAEPGSAEPQSLVRNQCIREQVSYDFGEMVEVNLMNTCNEPVMVYSCAEGTGRYQRRWVCQSSENAPSVLVRPGDRLVGNVAMLEVPEGIRTFRYVENLFVARARNSEYWWLACGVDDAECRGSGRQWARSMDGKAASVDPQLWTQQDVARSY